MTVQAKILVEFGKNGPKTSLLWVFPASIRRVRLFHFG
jgi:hypothetical protein